MRPDVSILIVAHNDAADLPASLASALVQEGVASEIVVVDNASSDLSREVVRPLAGSGVRLVELSENRGYAGGMNAGIAATSGRYLLCLNPDCRLAPEFVATLVRRLDASDAADAGSASGKLLRAEGPELQPTRILDSTGIVESVNGRYFDRGTGEPDSGRFDREETIFGASGAAAFFRRTALEAVKISTGYFDEDFFLYREDVDLAWRLANAGWRCLYVPQALGYHRRRNLPSRRRQMPALVNYHSVKNRFLLRINNQRAGQFWATLVPTLARDLIVLAACLAIERSSLPAFRWLWRNRKRLLAKRREIQALLKRAGPGSVASRPEEGRR